MSRTMTRIARDLWSLPGFKTDSSSDRLDANVIIDVLIRLKLQPFEVIQR